LQDAIEIPAFYHRQWEPDYPEFVEFKYDGANYEIRVRKHKGKLFFVDGLTTLRIELQIYESITINFLACDHHSKFDLHFTPPLHQQACKRPRHASRKHIWTYQITQSMLGAPYPLAKYSYLFISFMQMLISMLNFFFPIATFTLCHTMSNPLWWPHDNPQKIRTSTTIECNRAWQGDWW